jgi:hypothetical protein
MKIKEFLVALLSIEGPKVIHLTNTQHEKARYEIGEDGSIGTKVSDAADLVKKLKSKLQGFLVVELPMGEALQRIDGKAGSRTKVVCGVLHQEGLVRVLTKAELKSIYELDKESDAKIALERGLIFRDFPMLEAA